MLEVLIHCHSIRSNGAYIYGTNGRSNGIIPMLKVYNDTARYVDQGGGKRNGSFLVTSFGMLVIRYFNFIIKEKCRFGGSTSKRFVLCTLGV